jgi:hypothetical protein
MLGLGVYLTPEALFTLLHIMPLYFSEVLSLLEISGFCRSVVEAFALLKC